MFGQSLSGVNGHRYIQCRGGPDEEALVLQEPMGGVYDLLVRHSHRAVYSCQAEVGSDSIQAHSFHYGVVAVLLDLRLGLLRGVADIMLDFV